MWLGFLTGLGVKNAADLVLGKEDDDHDCKMSAEDGCNHPSHEF